MAASIKLPMDWMACGLILLLIGIALVPPTQAEFPISKEGCRGFCRKTGFSGVIGNCACGHSLFSKRTEIVKRSPVDWYWNDKGDQVQVIATNDYPFSTGAIPPMALFGAKLTYPIELQAARVDLVKSETL